MATHTKRRNSICQLFSSLGQCLTSHEDKAIKLWNAFKSRLGSSDFSRIHYDLSDLIQPSQLLEMDHPFSEEEIKLALSDMPLDHAPGPDGFNGLFLKKCWPRIKNDFDRLLQQFWSGNLDIEAINSSFITIIPKKDSPRTINDYMPIYLLNSSLKLLTKLLANRLQSVILSVVHTN
jgi:hypothetical protein